MLIYRKAAYGIISLHACVYNNLHWPVAQFPSILRKFAGVNIFPGGMKTLPLTGAADLSKLITIISPIKQRRNENCRVTTAIGTCNTAAFNAKNYTSPCKPIIPLSFSLFIAFFLRRRGAGGREPKGRS